jgi:hypothetical protein
VDCRLFFPKNIRHDLLPVKSAILYEEFLLSRPAMTTPARYTLSLARVDLFTFLILYHAHILPSIS